MGVIDNKNLYRLEVKKPSTTDNDNNIVMNTEVVHLQVDLADKVKNPLTIKLNNGSTEGTNLFTYDGSASKTINISLDTLGAAASTHTHISLKANTDNRGTNTIPNDYNGLFKITGLKLNSKIGISTAYGMFSSVVGLRCWTDSSGGNAHELAFTGNGCIFHRNGSTTSWSDWSQIAYTSNIPTKVSQLTNDSGYITGKGIGSATQPVYVDASGAATTCSTYGGGTAVTLNGTSKAASTASFYAPTTAGTSGYFLKSNGSGAPTWSSITIPTVNNGILTMNTSGTGLSGSASFTANQSGNSTFTVTINSSTAGNRAANTIVAASAAGTISSEKFNLTSSGTSKANILYNSTADCIEFVFA